MDPNRPNPLQFSVILQKALSYLGTKSRKRCRLVCKFWESEANRFLQIKKHPLILSKHSESFRISNYIIIPSNIGPDFFTITKTIIEELNSNNFHVKYLQLQNPGWTLSQLQFIITSLPKLEELTLSKDFVLSKVDEKIRPNLRELTSNLKTLELNLKDDNLSNLGNIEFLLELYKIAPNLQKVKCWSGHFSEPVGVYTEIFSNLLFRSIVESASYTNNITSLDINLNLRNEDITLLERANLPLKTLHLPLDIMISCVRVDNLLASLISTLKRLKLTHRNCIRSVPLFENLINLEYLAIHGYDMELKKDPRTLGDQTVFYIFNIVPLTMFPSFLEGFQFNLTKLEEICLNNVYFVGDDIMNFQTLFPNLRRINVSFLDDEMLRSVFKNYGNLECLIVKDGRFTDSGISGIGHEVQEILENGLMNDLGCERLREFPNISSLKYLQTLELASPNVTDFGVINGISLCRSVQELKLNLPKIRDRSLRILTKNLNLDILEIKSGTFSKTVVEEANLKMKGGAFSLFLLNQFKN